MVSSSEHNQSNLHDLIIVGAGPAGLAAAIYASRSLLDVLTLEQTAPGGQVLLASEIDNYPAVPNTAGFDLIDAMEKQASDLGAQITTATILKIESDSKNRNFRLVGSGCEFSSRSVVVATGAVPRRARFAGEERFAGHGVSYCATCDAMFYRGKEVFVVGSDDIALKEAMLLSRFASHVTLLVRTRRLKAQRALVESLEATGKVEIRYQTNITKIEGAEFPSSITISDATTKQETTQTFEEGSFGVFVFDGKRPMTDVLGDLVDVSDAGGVITNERMETKTAGLYCAGDVREKPLRQIVTAASDGAIAATMAVSYLGK